MCITSREQLDKKTSRCKESGEKDNERHKRRTKACIVGKIINSRMKWAGHTRDYRKDHEMGWTHEGLPKRSRNGLDTQGITEKIMKWAGHTRDYRKDHEMGWTHEGLPKRSETKKQEGCRKRGRPQLRWGDCVKRDLRKAEEEEKWREKANSRDQWKTITKVAVQH